MRFTTAHSGLHELGKAALPGGIALPRDDGTRVLGADGAVDATVAHRRAISVLLAAVPADRLLHAVRPLGVVEVAAEDLPLALHALALGASPALALSRLGGGVCRLPRSLFRTAA